MRKNSNSLKVKKMYIISLLVSLLLVAQPAPSIAQQAAPFDCQNQTQSQTNTQNCGSSAKGGWLIMMLISTLKEAATSAASSQANSMFNSWFGWLFGKATIKPDQQQVGGTITANTDLTSPPNTAVTAGQQTLATEQAVIAPMLAIQAVFLQGTEPNAQQHPVYGIAEIKSQDGQPLVLDVYNNDVYALRITPTTPGILRLTSIDSQKTEALDVLAMLPGRVNRFPIEGDGGILVDTNVGTETLRVEFEPCAPEALRNDPVMKAFAGRLQRCTLSMTQANVTQTNGKSVNGDASTKPSSKGMTLTQPRKETKVGLIGVDKGYLPGNILIYDIIVKHSMSRAL